MAVEVFPEPASRLRRRHVDERVALVGQGPGQMRQTRKWVGKQKREDRVARGQMWEKLPEIEWHVKEVVLRLHSPCGDLLVLDEAVFIDDRHQPHPPARKGIKYQIFIELQTHQRSKNCVAISESRQFKVQTTTEMRKHRRLT